MTQWERPDLGGDDGSGAGGGGDDSNGIGGSNAGGEQPVQGKTPQGATPSGTPLGGTPLGMTPGGIADDVGGSEAFGTDDRDADGQPRYAQPASAAPWAPTEESATVKAARLAAERKQAMERRASLLSSIRASDAVIDPNFPEWVEELCTSTIPDAPEPSPEADSQARDDKPMAVPPLSEIGKAAAEGYTGYRHTFELAFDWLSSVQKAESERGRTADVLRSCGACRAAGVLVMRLCRR